MNDVRSSDSRGGSALEHFVVMTLFVAPRRSPGFPQKFYEAGASRLIVRSSAGSTARALRPPRRGHPLRAAHVRPHRAPRSSSTLRHGSELTLVPTGRTSWTPSRRCATTSALDGRAGAVRPLRLPAEVRVLGPRPGRPRHDRDGLRPALPDARRPGSCPGELIPVAKVAHSNEGLMAFLVVITWHIYNAHLTPDVFPFDTAIFTGKISRRAPAARAPARVRPPLRRRRPRPRRCERNRRPRRRNPLRRMPDASISRAAAAAWRPPRPPAPGRASSRSSGCSSRRRILAELVRRGFEDASRRLAREREALARSVGRRRRDDGLGPRVPGPGTQGGARGPRPADVPRRPDARVELLDGDGRVLAASAALPAAPDDVVGVGAGRLDALARARARGEPRRVRRGDRRSRPGSRS